MRHLITMVLLLVISISLAGQESTAKKLKRWQFSGQWGLELTPADITDNTPKGSKLLLTELTYRLHRNVDAGLQLGMQKETWSGFSSLQLDVFEFGSFRTSWNSQRQSVFLGLYIKLNYRVGQGDLSISGAYGLNRHTNNVRARSPMPFTTKVKMAPLLVDYSNFQISYTYWATPQFGLIAGYSVIDLIAAGVYRNNGYTRDRAPAYFIKEWEAEGAEVSEENLENLAANIGSSIRHYLTLGVTTRIF